MSNTCIGLILIVIKVTVNIKVKKIQRTLWVHINLPELRFRMEAKEAFWLLGVQLLRPPVIPRPLTGAVVPKLNLHSCVWDSWRSMCLPIFLHLAEVSRGAVEYVHHCSFFFGALGWAGFSRHTFNLQQNVFNGGTPLTSSLFGPKAKPKSFQLFCIIYSTGLLIWNRGTFWISSVSRFNKPFHCQFAGLHLKVLRTDRFRRMQFNPMYYSRKKQPATVVMNPSEVPKNCP